MKIMFVATPNAEGHHSGYFEALAKTYTDNGNHDVIAVLPQSYNNIDCRQIFIKNVDWSLRKLKDYLKFLNELIKISREESPDIIHIQCGDNFYRFFGIGLFMLKEFNPVITFHHMRRSFLRDISLKIILRSIKFGVVHTKSLKDMLNNMGINNVKHIEYPQMNNLKVFDVKESKSYFNLNDTIPVLAAIGGTRYDKGLDILLEALKRVRGDYQLLIAGSESTIKKDYILNATESYSEKVSLNLKYLSSEELNLALNAADIIVLPYRKIFDGASGPLGEGCWLRKCIIGPNHGSLGEIIKENRLGLTFETENYEDLAGVIDESLTMKFEWTNKAEEYRRRLTLENFVQEYDNIFYEAIK